MLKASYRALNSHHFGVGLHYHYTTTGLPAYSWLNSYNFGAGLDFDYTTVELPAGLFEQNFYELEQMSLSFESLPTVLQGKLSLS